MNREIKFRAWTGSEMTTKIAVAGNGHKTTWTDGDAFSLSSVLWPVMQFTGLKDKNGKEIWEGDVLRIHDPEKDDGMGPRYAFRAVRFESGAFLMVWEFGEYDITYLGWALEWFSNADIIVEVIGNIYENPDLLT